MKDGYNKLIFMNMKNITLNITILFLSIFMIIGCKTPDDLTPSVSRQGINSITAKFLNDESTDNAFTSEIDYENGIIKIVFPYNYPRTSENVLSVNDLKNLRVVANLDDNVSISPSILYMDFTKENIITVTDQKKVQKQYKVIADIRKNSDSKILEFNLLSNGLNGVINEEAKTISIVSIEDIIPSLSTLSLSHGAVISPDPRTQVLNYNQEVKLTVTAQDGISTSVYTVKKNIPEKIELGLRTGSAKVLWAKKIQSDLGISVLHKTNGISATKDHIIINTQGENSIYLNSKTGAVEGRLNMSNIAGQYTNFYSTADDDDNILISNLSPEAGSFKIWKIKGVASTPSLFLEYNGGQYLGRKFSIQGSIEKNAIITAPIAFNDNGNYFLRWQVVNGSLVSQTPQMVEAKITSSRWRDNSDVIYTSSTNLESDYFVAYYGTPYRMAWVDGKTHGLKASGPEISGNWIINAVDYKVFNNNPYVAHTTVNSFTWGSDDSVLLFDANSTSSIVSPIWRAPVGTYGGKENGGQNAWGTSDVAIKVSENGYYMYVYFLFTNGQVVCVQFDCIKM